MEPADALKDILVINYAETKQDFDKLDAGMKTTFLAALDDLSDPFIQNASAVEMTMTGMEDAALEKIFSDINDWQQDNDPE